MIRVPIGTRHTVKLAVLGVLALVLQIPVLLIGEQVGERRRTRDSAAEEIRRTWGREQRVVGPILRVPYVDRRTEERGGVTHSREAIRYVHILPESLTIAARAANDARRRGIFDVPVYEARLAISGRFAIPGALELGVDPAALQWDRAEVLVRVSDPTAIAEGVQLRWNERSVAFLPGSGGRHAQGGIHAPVGRPDEGSFALELGLRGSDSLLFAPLGKETTLQLSSDWPTPSFVGAWLPVDRSVERDGFQARWHVSYLGRGYPQTWSTDGAAGDGVGGIEQAIGSSAFGVRFLAAVDPYRMALRSTKYAILFIGLTFSVLWLFEILAGLPSHPVQYLLIGGALCLFYLLELALSEHLGFTTAYVVATAAVAGLVSAYAVAVLRNAWRAALVGGLLSGLYGYLFVVLRAEDFALLLGSLGLFAALAGIMYLTRGVDWYGRAGVEAAATGAER